MQSGWPQDLFSLENDLCNLRFLWQQGFALCVNDLNNYIHIYFYFNYFSYYFVNIISNEINIFDMIDKILLLYLPAS